jgi:hypothetical protein
MDVWFLARFKKTIARCLVAAQFREARLMLPVPAILFRQKSDWIKAVHPAPSMFIFLAENARTCRMFRRQQIYKVI